MEKFESVILSNIKHLLMSQAWINEEGYVRLGEPTLKVAILEIET
jgi:hypothetical protein